ncbi:MAG: hypothetical protein ACYSRZ_07070 [Planctomycetota bacterium]
MVHSSLGYQLYACGRNALPKEIVSLGQKYRLCRVFKHDFFAATALYESCSELKEAQVSVPARIVLKLNRQEHFLGLPLLWLGEAICDHEFSVLERLKHVEGVPHVLSRYGKTGLIYEYIEGDTLENAGRPPADFFDKLAEQLGRIHNENVAYLDMNKRGNILVGGDGKAYIIDFQIALYIDDDLLIWRRLSEYLRNILQSKDVYHLFKHKRRICPELLKAHEEAMSRRISGLIQLHRFVATPLRRLRRFVLKLLGERGFLVLGKDSRAGDEDDMGFAE